MMKQTIGSVLLLIGSACALAETPAGMIQILAKDAQEVGLEKPGFWLDSFEVSVAQYREFASKSGYVSTAEKLGSAAVMQYGTGYWRLVEGADWQRPLGPDAEKSADDQPVTQVSWFDAQAYCRAAGKRLPTAAELSYVIDKGKSDAMAQPSANKANIWTGFFPLKNTAEDGFLYSAPVGSFPPNALGFYDITGNVWEWTSDEVLGSGEKIQKGGSYLCSANFCRGWQPKAQTQATPDSSLMHVGFRCAKSVEPSP